jgi:hypothetical protein
MNCWLEIGLQVPWVLWNAGVLVAIVHKIHLIA